MEITLAFIPIFIFTILAEALVIQARHGSYSWKNTGVSTLVAVGHFRGGLGYVTILAACILSSLSGSAAADAAALAALLVPMMVAAG